MLAPTCFLLLFVLCSLTCISPSLKLLKNTNIDTIVTATILNYNRDDGFLGVATVAVNCRFRYINYIGDQITIHIAPARSSECTDGLAEGSQFVFFLTATSQSDVFYTDVSASYDGYTQLSNIDIMTLRQTAYASGIMPSGDFCPEDCMTGSDWSDWSECSSNCGSGSVYRHLQTNRHIEGSMRCPIVTESAFCHLKQCNPVINPLDNTDTLTDTHMVIGKCQTVKRVEHMLCTKLCEVGYENKPVSWTVRPLRVLCDRHTIKFKAVMVVTQCGCHETEYEDFLDSFFGY